ncbi:hypothetical protein, partial [Stenotrophomonas sp. SrG]|uniref:hypothetical protein n=1 Tax=Stenotrophomonas sp. SrG TaxID=3414430 RepID=UPI003CF19496
GTLREGSRSERSSLLDNLPAPSFRCTVERPWNIRSTGVGGTGVVTIGAGRGLAGPREGKGASGRAQSGRAPKGGAV